LYIPLNPKKGETDMVKAEIKEHDDGTATLYLDDQASFSGTPEECQEEMFRMFEETMDEIGKIASKK
jgi:hypothetical protein